MAINLKNNNGNPDGKPKGNNTNASNTRKQTKSPPLDDNNKSMWAKLEDFIGGLLPKPIKIEVESESPKHNTANSITRQGVKQNGGSPADSFSLKSSGSRMTVTSQKGSNSSQQRPEVNNTSNGSQQQSQQKPQGKRLMSRPMTYTRPVKHEEKVRKAKLVEVEEISNTRLIAKKPVLETVKNINEVKFFDRISLVNYYMAKNSGKLDEKASKEEHFRNTQKMKRVYTLTNMIYESSIRNLEHAGHESFILQVDSKFRDILDEVIDSKLLSSFDITIYYENKVLTRLNAEPTFLEIKLKKL